MTPADAPDPDASSPKSPGDPGWEPEDAGLNDPASGIPPLPINIGSLDPGGTIPVSEYELQSEVGKAAFAHWGAIFLGWIAGVVVLLWHPVNAGRYQEVHAKESLNFSVIMLIGYLISVLLAPVAIGFITFVLVYGFDIWNRVKAARAADAGRLPQYWMPFRVLVSSK